MLRGVKGKIRVQWSSASDPAKASHTSPHPLPHTPTRCYIMVNPIHGNDSISNPNLRVLVPHNSGNAHAHLCGKRLSKPLSFCVKMWTSVHFLALFPTNLIEVVRLLCFYVTILW